MSKHLEVFDYMQQNYGPDHIMSTLAFHCAQDRNFSEGTRILLEELIRRVEKLETALGHYIRFADGTELRTFPTIDGPFQSAGGISPHEPGNE